MATDVSEDTAISAEESPPPEPSPQRKLKLSSKKTEILGLLLVVMAVQVAVGCMLLPKPVDPESGNASGTDARLVNDTAKDVDQVEVEIGQFNPTNRRAAPGSVIHVSFKLTAMVSANLAQTFQAILRDTHEARVSQAVIKVARSSSLEDLNDVNLDIIKRKIREDVNKVLQKSYIIDVVITQFRTTEQ